MIISDKYRFCFIHVPKCAGTSVRGSLRPFDDTQGRFTGYVGEHEVLGPLDYVHIPLKVLREHFNTEYEKIKSYQSFAVVRDPYSRFPSSLAQRLNRYGEKPVHEMSKQEITKALDEVISFLCEYGDADVLPPDYIHFQKQSSYLFDQGLKLIDKIYLTDDIENLLMDIGNIIGEDLVSEGVMNNTHANKTMIYKSEFMKNCWPVLRALLSWSGNLLPKSLKQSIRNNIYTSLHYSLMDVFESDHVRSFVKDYYSVDIDFYASIATDK